MKRILAVLFVVALGFTMISGCACNPKECPQPCMQAIDALRNSPCDASNCEAAAARAEAAAARAQAAADKAESIFMRHMKK